MSNFTAGGYAGDISATQTYAALEQDTAAVLVDVRTVAEWSYVGVPDLSPLGRQALFVEWQRFPDGARNPGFVDEVCALLERHGATKENAIYFLCRSGVRSQGAATALTQAGFSQCFNVLAGFEGPLDESAHRATLAGWKQEGLPWRQS
ncbi:rhodanese-like domain-containing protein [Breoghania sp.]|uniref:rhodanese-like domain-containing protein n=1 Tax=Breoghania sp. TaxID=2065378 RepID=UPI002AA75402|nr:rhodanese-like domain-containing protein [Breoghania sp.]